MMTLMSLLVDCSDPRRPFACHPAPPPPILTVIRGALVNFGHRRSMTLSRCRRSLALNNITTSIAWTT